MTAKLPPEAKPIDFCITYRHGTMKLGLYAPRGPDVQVPHAQAEIFLIAVGSG